MVEKIFGKTGSIQEINQMALNLRKLRMKEELLKLAEGNKVSKSDTEDFQQGKQYFLVDGGNTEKFYETARSKVVDEMFQLNDPLFGNIIGGYLLSHCNKCSFEQQILRSHKTLQRCIEYLMKKAYGTVDEEDVKSRKNVGVALAGDMVYGWVNDYYASDDKEEAVKNMKDADAAFTRRRATTKLSDSKTSSKKSASHSKRAKQTKKQEERNNTAKQECTENDKAQVAGQVSLFEADLSING